MKRIGIGGFLHESNTFLGVPTSYQDFASVSLTRGPALLRRWGGAHHELGGFLEGLEGKDVELVPLLATYAVPSGTILAEAFEQICAELLAELRAALPLDGLLLALHGATVSEQHPDADGELLSRVRAVVGPDLPIITTLDLHANVSERMIRLANATVVYRTNPHLDQRRRGVEAATLLLRMLAGEIRPVQALERPPMIIQIAQQFTGESPARELYADLEQVMSWPGILSASIAMGFYYADVAEMGTAFLAVADGDAALAQRAALWMAERAWARRSDFTGPLPSPEQAVQSAAAATALPVVLMDIGDNVGAGSPADSTILFAEVMRQKVSNALVILADPQAVAQCVAAGAGGRVSMLVGAKTDSLHGQPVLIEGIVRTLSDGHYVETQARHGGWGVCEQGVTAVVETDDQHTVVLTTKRMAPLSLEQILSLGIHPERKRILIVKGVVAPRAAYEPVAASIELVDTGGVTSNNPFHFQYKNRRTPLFPLEENASY